MESIVSAKKRGFLFRVLLLVIVGSLIYHSFGYGSDTRLFPIIVLVAIFLLVSLDLTAALISSGVIKKDEIPYYITIRDKLANNDETFAESNFDSAESSFSTELRAILWVGLFVVLTYIAGFGVPVVVYLIMFLYFETDVKLGYVVVVGLVVGLGSSILFFEWLGIRGYAGQVEFIPFVMI